MPIVKTVGELRAFLANLGDEIPIHTSTEFNGVIVFTNDYNECEPTERAKVLGKQDLALVIDDD